MEMPVTGQVAKPKAVLILLDSARYKRDAAARARQLAGDVTTQSVYEELTRYANELEQIAHGLEQQAARLAKIARTHALSEEIQNLVTGIHARLKSAPVKKHSDT